MPQAVVVAIAKPLVAWGLKASVALAVSSFAVNTALYSVASFATNKLLGKRAGGSGNLQERQASVLNVSLGEVPREAVFGTCVTGGSLVDAFNHGGQYGTDVFTQCIALADHPVSRLLGVYVDDQYVPFGGSGVVAGFNGKLSITFENATADGHPPPAIALAKGWSTSDVGRGVARVWVSATFDETVWTQGFPRLRWLVEGLKLYDPRLDPRFGYDGPTPCDYDDPSTWVVSQNPALQRYTYARGIYVAGRHGDPAHLMLGRGLSELEAPSEPVIAPAILCDEAISEGEVRHTAAGVVRADQAFIDVEEMFAAAMDGVIVQREGGVEVEPGQAKAAVAVITDADLVIGEPARFSAFLPDGDGGRINTVVPRFVSPAQNWRDHAGPVRRDADDIQADGGPRETTLALALVTSAAQADRSAEIARRLFRLERRAAIVLPPRFSWLEEGDWIAWSSDRFHEGATVRYRIESWSLGEDWRMRLSLREIAGSVYGEADSIADEAASPPPPEVLEPLAIEGFTAESVSLTGGPDQSSAPALRVAWSTPTDPAIRAVRVEVRRVGSPDVAVTRTEDMAAGALIVTEGVAPDADLEVRLAPIALPGRPVAPTDWAAVVSSDLVANDTVNVGGEPAEDLLAGLAAAGADAAAALSEIAAEVLRATTSESAITASLSALEGEVSANYMALVDADAGLAALISSTQSQLDGFEASAGSTLAALALADGALASRTDAIEARANMLPNLLENSGFTDGFRGWTNTANWSVEVSTAVGSAALTTAAGTQFIYSDFKVAQPGQVFGLAMVGDGGAGAANNDSYGFIEIWATDDGVPTVKAQEICAVALGDRDWSTVKRSAVESNSSGGLAWRFGFRKANTDVAAFSRVMVCAGPPPLTWSDQATDRSLAARVALAELAAVDFATQKAIAAWEVRADASGGSPARLGLVSTNYGPSGVVLDADLIGFGDNTVFDNASDTLRTSMGGGRLRVVGWGASFGASANLREWIGADSVALGSMTTANADFAIDSAGKVYRNGVVQRPTRFDTVSTTATKVHLPNLLWEVDDGDPETIQQLRPDAVVASMMLPFSPAANDVLSVGLRLTADANTKWWNVTQTSLLPNGLGGDYELALYQDSTFRRVILTGAWRALANVVGTPDVYSPAVFSVGVDRGLNETRIDNITLADIGPLSRPFLASDGDRIVLRMSSPVGVRDAKWLEGLGVGLTISTILAA